MKTYKTVAQWLGLLQQRSNFKGTNVEFCQHHNVSITTFYKQRALLAEGQSKSSVPELTPTPTPTPTLSRFIQVKQTMTEVCAHTHQHPVLFDTRTGQLTLPADFATTDIVTIIKGLMA